MCTSYRPPTVIRRTSRFLTLLLCLVASCAPLPAAEMETRREATRSCSAAVIEGGRLAYHVADERLEKNQPASHRRSQNSAPAARNVPVRAAAPRPDAGATLSAEPRPNHSWDDCVMAGLAVSPRCGI